MNINKLKHNPAAVHATLTELKDNRLVTIKGCKIYIPVRFTERGLATIGLEISIVGIFAIVVNDSNYATSIVNAMVRITPTSTIKVIINEEEYYEFTFEPGATVIPSLDLVKEDTLTYRIYDEIIAKGRVPWYMGYRELGKIFDTAKKHAGANIGENREVTELIVSMISRDPSNRHVYYRSIVKDANYVLTNPPVYIPLRSVTYAATNTTNKLAGSYFSDGLTSALVSPSDRNERIETILRR